MSSLVQSDAILSALRSSRLAAWMLSLIQGAQRRSVTDLVLSGACRSRSNCLESLYFPISSPSGQSASTVLHMAFTSEWNFSGLVFSCSMWSQSVSTSEGSTGSTRRRVSCGQTEGSLTRTRHGKPVKNMTAHVSRLADDLGKVMLREQGAEFWTSELVCTSKWRLNCPMFCTSL